MVDSSSGDITPLEELPEENVFRWLYDQPCDLVAVFDILGTRRRIERCKNRAELEQLAGNLRKLAQGAVADTVAVSETVAKGRSNWGFHYENEIEFRDAIHVTLIQDSIVVCFDFHKCLAGPSFKIQADLLHFLYFACKASQNILDSLLENGFLARAAIGAGTLAYDENLVLGTAFINAYEHADGSQSTRILGVQVAPSVVDLQDRMYAFHRGTGCHHQHFLDQKVYVKHGKRIFLDPGIWEPTGYALRIALMEQAGCNQAHQDGTTALLESCLLAWYPEERADQIDGTGHPFDSIDELTEVLSDLDSEALSKLFRQWRRSISPWPPHSEDSPWSPHSEEE